MLRWYLFLIFYLSSYCLEVNLPLILIAPPTVITPNSSERDIATSQIFTSCILASNDINMNPSILPGVPFNLTLSPTFFSAPRAISAMISFDAQNKTLVVGNLASQISASTGIAGQIYGIAQLSGTASSPTLSNKNIYPFYSTLVPDITQQIQAIQDTLLYYESIKGRGWTDVAIISTTDEYGISLATTFINSNSDKFTIHTFQQFIYTTGTVNIDADLEFSEIKKSGARVIIAFIVGPWNDFIIAADSYGLIGDDYVWVTSDNPTGIPFTSNSSSPEAQLSRGVLGTFFELDDTNPEYIAFNEKWNNLDPNSFLGAGFPPFPYMYFIYDHIITAGLAANSLLEQGLLDVDRVSAETWTNAIRNVSYTGTSGFISFNNQGNRKGGFNILNFIPESLEWVNVALSTFDGDYIPLNDVVWYSNTTQIPDLDIRKPFNYWSCHNKEEGYDSTGKTISLHTPDGSDINNIESDYHCDSYIDCKNMSDEIIDCSTNYLIVYIIFGIITGILIFITIILIIFVCIFGIILKYRRLRVASPIFLIILLISIIFGYISIFTWYGKAHPVSCIFQPWLLGLSTISMIITLCAKNFRLWRIFRFPMKKIRISDFELILLWIISMIPAIFIVLLWTIISTPTADMEYIANDYHYICTTGGFTGKPGGYIFFSIFVAYGGLILFFGAFLSIATRKIPSQFNESSLIAISIYNLGFLSIVIIPVYIVIYQYNGFAAWILRTISILYAFSATLFLQFFPKVWGIIISDKFKNKKIFKSSSSVINSLQNKSGTTRDSTTLSN